MVLSIECGIIRKKFPFGCSERMDCYRTFRVNNISGDFKNEGLSEINISDNNLNFY
jgi:hypothetical protein